jgi:hypothetical protein
MTTVRTSSRSWANPRIKSIMSFSLRKDYSRFGAVSRTKASAARLTVSLRFRDLVSAMTSDFISWTLIRSLGTSAGTRGPTQIAYGPAHVLVYGDLTVTEARRRKDNFE